MTDGRVRVVIVDDSLVSREMLAQILMSDPDIEVVGQASDGKQGVDMVAHLRPDLVTMDIHMPHMNGVEAVTQIMAYSPTPILVVSSSVRGPGIGTAFEAMNAGALEVMKKPEPRDWEDLERIGREIIRKVKLLSRVKVITHIAGKRKRGHVHTPASLRSTSPGRYALVAVGSSTGGPSALMTLLGGLERDFPLPVLVAQHIAEGFIPGLVEWLDGGCKISVTAAEDGTAPRAGVAYLAPTGQNLEFDGRDMRFAPMAPGQLYVPSVDTLFSSIARSLRSASVGVILTGMGADGARGLKEIRDAGGATIAQDEKSSTVYGMPRVAAESGAAEAVLSVEDIPGELERIVAK